jgi:flagellar basal-body rod protein FlgG
MIRGLYTSAAGMLSGLLRHETIVHNLANIRTAGYKADQATLQDFPALLLTQIEAGEPGPEVGRAGTGVSLAALTTDFSEGPMKLTNHPFDFAVAGEGFFQVQTPEGVRYTRDGRFHRDVDGRFITAEGYPVLGANGPITLPEGQLTATPNGLLFVNDVLIDQLSLVNFDDPANIIKAGDTLFASRGAPPPILPAAETQVYQGYLEDSNVDASKTVTEMMSVLRAYQASQRLVQFQDQINGQAVSELGRV